MNESLPFSSTQKNELYPGHVLERDLLRMLKKREHPQTGLPGWFADVLATEHRVVFDGEDGNAVLDAIRQLPEQTAAELVRRVVPLIQQYMQRRWKTPRAMEEWARQQKQRDPDVYHINDVLNFDIHETTLYLHVYPSTSLGLAEFRKQFKEGLTLIAQRIETDPSLQQIQTITGISWLVAEARPLLERLGFTVEENPDEPTSPIATMSREEFIKRFGQK